jgi:hypothetical protein
MAREFFGEDADAVIDHRNALKKIEEEGSSEIATRRQRYAEERNKTMAQFQAEGQQFQTVHQQMTEAIIAKYPQFFGQEGATKEEKEALQKGMDFVDSSIKNGEALKPEERAQKAALLRLWAASFPRLVEQIKSLKAQIEARDADLKKYRKSDPGSGGDSGSSSSGKPAPKGTDALAMQMGKEGDGT